MNTYTFALAYFDGATFFVGNTPVEILAKSLEDAAQKLRALRHNPEWLKTVPALDIRDPEDLDGIIAGEFLLMQETIAPPDSTESARSLQDEPTTSHNDEHAETGRAS